MIQLFIANAVGKLRLLLVRFTDLAFLFITKKELESGLFCLSKYCTSTFLVVAPPVL